MSLTPNTCQGSVLRRTLNVSATVDEVAKQLICSTAVPTPVSCADMNLAGAMFVMACRIKMLSLHAGSGTGSAGHLQLPPT